MRSLDQVSKKLFANLKTFLPVNTPVSDRTYRNRPRIALLARLVMDGGQADSDDPVSVLFGG